MLRLNTMDWVGHPCGDTYDEGDQLQAISTQPTPFIALLEWCSVHSACARVGLRGHQWMQKQSTMIFPQWILDHLGSSNKWFKAI